MLLAIDIGNTNLALGLFDLGGDPGRVPVPPALATRGEAALRSGFVGELRADWRLETRAARTADEYAALLSELFRLAKLELSAVTAVAVSSVVPAVLFPIERLCQKYLQVEPLVVGPGTKTGMPILYENPREVGADRIVNAVAAHERWPGGAIIVDFGTATTFDVITSRGEYAGGVIAPGITVSADALFSKTAKLPRVEIARPRSAVGRNTVASIQSGMVFGYAGLVDAIVERIRAEVDFKPRVVGTGGLATLIAKETRTIDECDDMLTLQGLALIYGRNR